jgi:hypothetical protein
MIVDVAKSNSYFKLFALKLENKRDGMSQFLFGVILVVQKSS